MAKLILKTMVGERINKWSWKIDYLFGKKGFLKFGYPTDITMD